MNLIPLFDVKFSNVPCTVITLPTNCLVQIQTEAIRQQIKRRSTIHN
ncbi:hypothetical protein [Xanthomonas graminis]|nr:hypothetical protein [Xanthomonas translucens]WIH15873.1 hypothetical protein KM433_19650 [Xanthomonas translucens pv. graminis]